MGLLRRIDRYLVRYNVYLENWAVVLLLLVVFVTTVCVATEAIDWFEKTRLGQETRYWLLSLPD